MLAAGSSIMACSQKPLPGETTFERAKEGFVGEISPAEREAAIKELQSKTNKQ
jgi:hypothetical protein